MRPKKPNSTFGIRPEHIHLHAGLSDNSLGGEVDYIEDYGWQYSIGDWQQEGKFLASCKVVDQTVWEKMIRPAYDHIIGNYPKSENDIMMSRSLLKKLGISNPQTGMEISAQILF